MIVVFRFYVRHLIYREVVLSYLAAQTDKFSGADLTEICQSACKIAIREEIDRGMEGERIKEDNMDGDDTREVDDDNVDDSMPEIVSRHFESAVRNAIKSVSNRYLAKYASFAQTLQQSQVVVTGSGGKSLASFPFPVQANSGDGTAGGAGASVEEEEEEKDLYSYIIHDTYSQIVHDINDATSDIFKYRTIGVVCFGKNMLLKEKEHCFGRSGSKGTSNTSKLNNI